MRVTLLTSGDPDRVTGGYLFNKRMADRATEHDAEVLFASIPDAPFPLAMAAGPRWLRTPAITDAEVVVLDSICAAATAPWLGALRRPIVAMVHQRPGGIEASRPARAIRALFDRWAYRRAALLMVASEYLADELAGNGIARRRLRVVPPGKDPAAGALVQPDESGMTRDDLRAGRQIAALCIANWLAHKGIVELLDALIPLPNDLVALHLVGDTGVDTQYANRVRDRLAAPELRDRVVVHGIVPATTAQHLYATADVFVLPSFQDAYGTVWGEAMAAGLPVVGWRAANLPYLADDGKEAILVPVGDVLALSNAIESLATDPELRLRLGAAAARRAATRPTWDETADMFFAAIEEAANRAGGRRTPTHRPTRRP